MNKKNIFQAISEALDTNNLQKAEDLLHTYCQTFTPDYMLYYMQGKLHMKRSEWGKAMSAFRRSEEIEPGGPAKQCRLMLEDIMAFYNKDMYNQ